MKYYQIPNNSLRASNIDKIELKFVQNEKASNEVIVVLKKQKITAVGDLHKIEVDERGKIYSPATINTLICLKLSNMPESKRGESLAKEADMMLKRGKKRVAGIEKIDNNETHVEAQKQMMNAAFDLVSSFKKQPEHSNRDHKKQPQLSTMEVFILQTFDGKTKLKLDKPPKIVGRYTCRHYSWSFE